MPDTILIIGNQNYSSWSFRAWLALKLTGLPFEQKKVYLRKSDTSSQLTVLSPSGKVPLLHHNGHVIWDSLAIGLFLADHFPNLLPQDIASRATALSIICEMHSGFQAMRSTITMDMKSRNKPYNNTDALQNDIQRIQDIWTQCRSEYHGGGAFLFGEYSLADVFFAPVVSRFVTYAIPISDVCQSYMESMCSHSFYQEWLSHAEQESETIDWTHPLPEIK